MSIKKAGELNHKIEALTSCTAPKLSKEDIAHNWLSRCVRKCDTTVFLGRGGNVEAMPLIAAFCPPSAPKVEVPDGRGGVRVISACCVSDAVAKFFATSPL